MLASFRVFFSACAPGKVSLRVIKCNYKTAFYKSESRNYSNSDMTWMHLLPINVKILFLAHIKYMYCFVL